MIRRIGVELAVVCSILVALGATCWSIVSFYQLSAHDVSELAAAPTESVPNAVEPESPGPAPTAALATNASHAQPSPQPDLPDPLATVHQAIAHEAHAAAATDQRTAATGSTGTLLASRTKLWSTRDLLVQGQFTQLLTRVNELQRDQESLVNQSQALMQRRDVLAQKQQRAVSSSRQGYAVLPYLGPNSTWQQPITIECVNGMAVLRPDGAQFSLIELSMDALGMRSSPLVAAIQRAIRLASSQPSPDGKPVVPYVLFLVRPDGIRPYYEARAQLERLGIHFGYELVEQDQDIDVPDPAEAMAALAPRPLKPSPPPLQPRPVAGAALVSVPESTTEPRGRAESRFLWKTDELPTRPVGGGGVAGTALAAADWPGDGPAGAEENDAPSDWVPSSGPSGGANLSELLEPPGSSGGSGGGLPSGGQLADLPGPAPNQAPGRPSSLASWREQALAGVDPVARAIESTRGVPGSLGTGTGTGDPSHNSGGKPGATALPDDTQGPGRSNRPQSGAARPGGVVLGGGLDGLAGGASGPHGPRSRGADANSAALSDTLAGVGQSAAGASGHSPIGSDAPGQPGASRRASITATGSGVARNNTPAATGLPSPDGTAANSSNSAVAASPTGAATGAGSGTAGGSGSGSSSGAACGAACRGVALNPSGVRSDGGDALAGLSTAQPSRPLELVVVCGAQGILIHPGAYRLSMAKLGEDDDLLVRGLEALVQRHRARVPGVPLEPQVRFLVEPGGQVAYDQSRRQLMFSGLDWPLRLEVVQGGLAASVLEDRR